MNEQNELLDTPLTGPFIGEDSNKREYLYQNKIDYFVNFILVASAIILVLAAMVWNQMLVLVFLWHLLLGGYQLLSALVGALRGNYQKVYYLAAPIMYVLLLFMSVVFGSQYSPDGQYQMYLWTFRFP